MMAKTALKRLHRTVADPRHSFHYSTTQRFAYKSDTDLYEFMKAKTAPQSLAFSRDGARFACVSGDRMLRLFDTASGKLVKRIDEVRSAVTCDAISYF
jgi:peptidylprolyl isomerase domain and WD repeat-containing protein 1